MTARRGSVWGNQHPGLCPQHAARNFQRSSKRRSACRCRPVGRSWGRWHHDAHCRNPKRSVSREAISPCLVDLYDRPYDNQPQSVAACGRVPMSENRRDQPEQDKIHTGGPGADIVEIRSW